MTCRMANKYNGWCKHLPSHADYEEGYCLFHAPKKPEIEHDVQNFNKRIFDHIREAKNAGARCDLSGTIFPGPINFSKIELPAMVFSHAEFTDEVDFGGALFSEESDTIFFHTKFKNKANFLGTHFYGNVFFKNTTFGKIADFWSAKFFKEADFENAKFRDVVDFLGTEFINGVFFTNSSFKNTANFKSTIFKKKVSFDHASFEGAVKFDIPNFNDEVNFRNIFAPDAQIRFLEADLSRVSFIGTDLLAIKFEQCKWPSKRSTLYKRLWVFSRQPIFPRFFRSSLADVLYDEIKTEKHLKEMTYHDWFVESSNEYGRIEDLYRQLKQQSKERHNETEASKWHYREKEMYRKKLLRRRIPLCSVLWWYWAISGYGERPLRAFLAIFFWIGITTAIMNLDWFGLQLLKYVSVSNYYESIVGYSGSFNPQKTWFAILNTIQHALFIKEPLYKAINPIGQTILSFFTRIIIPIQAALFAFALRNKLRR